MFIPLPAGSFGAAAPLALAHHKQQIEDRKQALADDCYNRLYEGAVHNGLKPSTEQLTMMREMAGRDAEECMADHPSRHAVEHLTLMIEAVPFLSELMDDVVIVEVFEFKILKDFLPKKE